MLTLPSFAGPTSARSVTRTVRMRFSVGTGHAPSLLPLVYSLFIRYGARVRKPTAPEQLYIDFDCFFAACEEQADRRLQGRPLAVIPFAGAVQSCVIAANTMATRAGVTTGMAIAAARRRCPGIALVPQQPDLYTRIHHRIVAAVLDVLPIEAVCSIDEFAATVEPRDIPAALTHQIKQRRAPGPARRTSCTALRRTRQSPPRRGCDSTADRTDGPRCAAGHWSESTSTLAARGGRVDQGRC